MAKRTPTTGDWDVFRAAVLRVVGRGLVTRKQLAATAGWYRNRPQAQGPDVKEPNGPQVSKVLNGEHEPGAGVAAAWLLRLEPAEARAALWEELGLELASGAGGPAMAEMAGVCSRDEVPHG